jgi:hypothetical protein
MKNARRSRFTQRLWWCFLPALAPLTVYLCIASTDVLGQDDSTGGVDADALIGLLELVIDPDTGDPESARQCLGVLAQKVQSRELAGEQLAALQPRLDRLLAGVLAGKPEDPLFLDAALLASSWKNPAAVDAVRTVFASAKHDDGRRVAALEALIAADDAKLVGIVGEVLSDAKGNSATLRGSVLQAVGRLDDANVADAVLGA